jgi:hypothetical protein
MKIEQIIQQQLLLASANSSSMSAADGGGEGQQQDEEGDIKIEEDEEDLPAQFNRVSQRKKNGKMERQKEVQFYNVLRFLHFYLT